MTVNGERPLVGVIMGSDSDIEGVMERAEMPLDVMRIPVEHGFKSAHRTSDRMKQYARTAEERGLKVLIAGAGGSAHLPGMVASDTILPVLGVAVTSAPSIMNRALGSLIGMPEGKPLATFQTGLGAQKAGAFAVRLLAPELKDMQRIAIVMSRDTEHKDMQHAATALDALGLKEDDDYEREVLATGEDVYRYSLELPERGVGLVIASSSNKRALPKALLHHTRVPVLGVALTSNPDAMSEELDNLVNTSEGYPLPAFQAKAGAFNAGLFAGRVLALHNPDVKRAYKTYDDNLERTVTGKDLVYGKMTNKAYLEFSKDKDALNESIENELNKMNS
jgi:5-(carboxyamino)imidazole ribonucleotide mutase